MWFWSNHFCVSADKVVAMAGAYEREAIRAHVLGRFADMLGAVERHPAMLFYLDNVQSMGAHSIAGINRDRGLNQVDLVHAAAFGSVPTGLERLDQRGRDLLRVPVSRRGGETAPTIPRRQARGTGARRCPYGRPRTGPARCPGPAAAAAAGPTHGARWRCRRRRSPGRWSRSAPRPATGSPAPR